MFLPKGMQHTALVGKTIWLKAGCLQRSLVDARKRAIGLEVKGYRLEGGLLAGVAARTEPSDGEYEKHLRAEPQDWTDGGNFTRHHAES